MRVTQNTTANLVLNSLQTIRRRTEELEQQAATGVKINAPGDDPVTAQQILHMKSLMAAGDQYSRNISNGISWLSMTEAAMDEMGNVLTRAKELTVQMANATSDAKARESGMNEIVQLRNQLIQLGNTQLNGRYVFGGFKNDTPPFDSTGAFNGTDDSITIEIDRGAFVPINYSGGELLRGGTPPGSTGTDIIGVFDNLITALGANDQTAVQAELPNLEDALSQVLSTRTDLGARMNRLEGQKNVIEEMKFSLTKVLSDKQDVDFMQVISDLTKQQTAFEAAIAASGKISQISLLDYLS
ncbi:flagellar hook-associated protein FlgL [Geobacter sulfurreducens]|jgi:flagellar hook-associated protein 3 FlgL|uniref:Flagellar hook-filament junction protein FlgL n=1 Tax=Geobacter sulfurreducens (strain ATCC 51573 / DSM 12127 / PCA) TaxID=243231 RepID=Q748G0_GEOSL|nr:flagellar hook-associated protein FlgL [Geobacter sulfurreducens]AAR36434.1 flagellar hook-filament junction protein FlgL [Geobacter sulfurreducens PCA]UAC03711.1 flagellar hook-associated protein FlgL [Geobacter sulfurreducens]BBA71443.1 Flagellar hook-associated protein 3 [Geobacter sulfurreducens]HBB70449.1 flagellar hook-associated protein 3 [Geobacter sulfurreducens]HCD95305.1 flagellar hook-associated protein 3 [Geobacter sulfurreducens]